MSRVSGHFGEWLQGRVGPEGPLALVTVPCPALWVEARRIGDGALALQQYPRVLHTAHAAAFLSRIGAGEGRFALRATMPPGGGAGASTGALLALAGASGVRLETAALIEACRAVEGASDPLMWPHPERLLWAPREGRVVAELSPLPLAEIVGGFWGPPERTDPADLRFPDIADLAAAVRRAPALADLGAIAAASSLRTSALRGPAGDPTAHLAETLGALGHLRAHTGSARGLVFAPDAVPVGAEAALGEAGFTGVIRFRTGGA